MPTDADALTSLSTLLRSADLLVREYLDEPLRRRLLTVFERMPPEDRDVIVRILEREVAARIRSREDDANLTGCETHVNPNAQLYVRALDTASAERVVTRDHEHLVFSSLRSVALMQLVLAPEMHDAWRAATWDAFARLDDEQRADVGTVLRESLDILESTRTQR